MREKNRLSLAGGLSFQQAKERLAQYGPNEIEKRKKLSPFKLLLNQFKSPLIYILFLAGLITLFLQEWTDAVVIFAAVGLNTVLGFIQEFKAEKALAALRRILRPQAQVIREGQRQRLPADQLVPGDIVVLSAGDKVPADGVLIESVDLHLDEAILTGESVAVNKLEVKDEKLKTSIQNLKLQEFKEENKVLMGTVVVSGRGKMLVVKTGQSTKMGRIASKLGQTVEEETPLKKQIGHLSRVLAVIFSLICVIIFFEGLLRGRSILAMFTLSVAVAVAAIPEGLVVSLTVILTLGMQRILKRRGLTRKLLAAETLGSVDVICADKTGTLTEGKMKVVGAVGDQEALIKGAILANNLINPLEIAMRRWAENKLKTKNEKLKINNGEELVNSFTRKDEIPFSSQRKFIAVLLEGGQGKGEIIISGAPEIMMAMALKKPAARNQKQKILNQYTKKGLRVVAFASLQGRGEKLKEDFRRLKEKSASGRPADYQFLELKFLGFLLFEDPVRLEVKKALRLCRRAGIEVKVITGDYRYTAAAVLNRLGLAAGGLKDSQIMEGSQLDKISSAELERKIEKIILFCRTTPEQKIRIVQTLQQKGHSVAMMGDGVNDALALKKADIGIVVGEASAVAKETADMVLLDSNFNTIVAAIEEGRGIFENIKKVVLYLLSDGFTEVILIGGSLLLGLPTPLLPAQILWVNLVEDGLPGLALAFEPKDEGLMNEKPRPKNQPILDSELKIIIFIIGLTADLFLFLIFYFLLRLSFSLGLIRTMIFASLAADSLLYVFSCKTLRKNLWHERLFSNRFLLFSVFLGFLMLFAGIYLPLFNIFLKTQPLPLVFWILVLVKALVTLAGIELVKWLFLHRRPKG